MNHIPQLRRDPISGNWILLVTGRARRPQEFALRVKDPVTPKKDCPFENPQESGNAPPVLWYNKKGKTRKTSPGRDWFLQVVPNKFPAIIPHTGICPGPQEHGPYKEMPGVGYHEVLITRNHNRFFSQMSVDEIELIVRAYQDRVLHYKKEECVEYSLVFHNHGRDAGASIYHPHSQIIALPILPPDVSISLEGALRYYKKHRECAHCKIIRWEQHKNRRVIYTNKRFIVIAPYASRLSFEIRIFPLQHSAYFEDITARDRRYFADALGTALGKLARGLKDPPYNFFIHSAPAQKKSFKHYHWHMEIMPKTSMLAGVELGSGVEVISMAPAEAAQFLKEQ